MKVCTNERSPLLKVGLLEGPPGHLDDLDVVKVPRPLEPQHGVHGKVGEAVLLVGQQLRAQCRPEGEGAWTKEGVSLSDYVKNTKYFVILGCALTFRAERLCTQTASKTRMPIIRASNSSVSAPCSGLLLYCFHYCFAAILEPKDHDVQTPPCFGHETMPPLTPSSSLQRAKPSATNDDARGCRDENLLSTRNATNLAQSSAVLLQQRNSTQKKNLLWGGSIRDYLADFFSTTVAVGEHTNKQDLIFLWTKKKSREASTPSFHTNAFVHERTNEQHPKHRPAHYLLLLTLRCCRGLP